MPWPAASLLLWAVVLLAAIGDGASRKSAQLPPLLANIYKAVEVRLPRPRLLPSEAARMAVPGHWADRYEKACLGTGPFDESFRYEELEEHDRAPNLGAEQFMLHLAHKAARWAPHKGTCLFTVNTFVGISLSGINDTAHLYGAIRQGLLRINATVLRSFRAIELTISSTAPGPLAVSVPQGTVFEGHHTEMPLVVLSSVMVHLLPGRSQTVTLHTYSMSLTGATPTPASAPRLTPFIYIAAFLKDFQNESPRSQLTLWMHTDRGRHLQTAAYQAKWGKAYAHVADWLVAPLLATCVWLGLAGFMWKWADKDAATSNMCFASVFSAVVLGARQWWHQPVESALLVLNCAADVAADLWLLVVVGLGAIGLLLCVAPSHRYLVKEHASYFLLLLTVGVARFVGGVNPQVLALALGFPLLLWLQLPVMVTAVLAVPALAHSRKAGVSRVFRQTLPLVRAVAYPALGAPCVAWAALVALGPRREYLQRLDEFAVDPVRGFPAIDGRWLSATAAVLVPTLLLNCAAAWRASSKPVEAKEKEKAK
eukprot:EG_transcript_8204